MGKVKQGKEIVPGAPGGSLVNVVNHQYRYAVRRYEDFLAKTGNDIMTGAKPFLDSLSVGAASYNQHLKAVKFLIRHAADNSDMTEAQRYRIEKHLEKLKMKQQHGGIKRTDAVPTPAEVKTLIETGTDHLALLIRFLWESSCRISEALLAQHKDARLSGDLCYIRIMGKGGKERTIRITAELYRDISEFYKGDQYLFTYRGKPYNRMSQTTAIRKHAEKTIGKRTSAHMIRHARGTLLSDRLGISKASEELGHSDIRVTKRFYDHTEVSEDEYMDLLKSGPPYC